MLIMTYREEKMDRTTPFSFDCKACGCCCHDKHIQLNPYEVLRMADFLDISTDEFLVKYIESGSPFLLFSGDNNSCVFLTGDGCSVHPARPLVCRLYPLGQYFSGERREHFKCIEPQPECLGKIDKIDTVADFLESQQTSLYMAASRQYLDLFDLLHQELYQELGEGLMDPPENDNSLGMTMAEWFDVDQINRDYCREKNLPVPTNTDDRIMIHIRALEERFSQH